MTFKVALPVPIYRLFEYLAPEGINLEMIKPGTALPNHWSCPTYGAQKQDFLLLEDSL
jgi:rubredoxin